MGQTVFAGAENEAVSWGGLPEDLAEKIHNKPSLALSLETHDTAMSTL